MKICIIGTGFVGLVAEACFADVGNNVICVDNNKDKISKLKLGIIEIYEPGLSELITSNIKNKRLTFIDKISIGVKNSDICFITVGTPKDKNGNADLTAVYNVAKEIGKSMNGYKLIINKSTTPVGTTIKIKKIIKEYSKYDFDIVSNPEFLKQGNAVDDFMHPDRTVVGIENEKVKSLINELYSPFFRLKNRIMYMDIASAEMTKYASNAFLATKISFINEIANLCELYNANIDLVRAGMAADERIGNKFLFPGIGYGGSCFPKDVSALIKMGEHKNYNTSMLKATEYINNNQIHLFLNKIIKRFNGKLENKKIAIWGLSFKPKTNDIRDAASITIINKLLKRKCLICAYDPEAIESTKSVFKNKIIYAKNSKDALKDADCLIILTEWNEFRIFNYKENKKIMKQKIIFDGRNQFDTKVMKQNGFEYYSIGR